MEPTSLAITASAWIWNNYGKAVTDKTAENLQNRWNKFRWKDAAEAYRAKVKKLCGTMQIVGMAEPVPLDDIFTDAYVLDKPTALGRFDIEKLKTTTYDPTAPPGTARINGLKLVREKDNLFILGKPGAGKTTFLKYVAIQAAEENIDKIPILVSLKEWSDSKKDLMPFIESVFDICNFPSARPFAEELLESGRAILLFDGLDETNEESGERDRQILAIQNLVRKYDTAQCLITCRIAATDYSFTPFTYVEIADFTENQIKRFVKNWFRKDKETGDKFLEDFGRAENKGLRELARAPLLLTLLCLAYNETLTFPQRRVEIYKEAFDALLKKWDSSRRIKRDDVYRKLSLGHKENMLSRIAAGTFAENKYFMSQSELESLITDYVRNVPPHDASEEADGHAILKSVEAQHGIFVERARQVYSFSHLTFQEYLTAKYIVDNSAQGTLSNLLQHCTDSRWREVFLLTTSLLPDATQFIETFRSRVDEFLADDEELQQLLLWASRKASSMQNQRWLARKNYLSMEVWYRSYFFGLHSVFAGNYGIDPKLTLDLTLASSLAFTLAIIEEIRRSAAFRIPESAKILEDLYAVGSDAMPPILKQELFSLDAPRSASIEDWQEFEVRLRSLLIRHRDLGHRFNLKDKQHNQLENYLTANKLLLDCFDLAFMKPDRKQQLLNNLYLPIAANAEDD